MTYFASGTWTDNGRTRTDSPAQPVLTEWEHPVLGRAWRNEPNDYDTEEPMPIFESGQPLHAREVTVLGHSFTIWQQQHPDEVRAVLQDMINQGDIKPIAFAGPNTTTLPENFEFIIKGEVAENGEFFFGVSTIEA